MQHYKQNYFSILWINNASFNSAPVIEINICQTMKCCYVCSTFIFFFLWICNYVCVSRSIWMEGKWNLNFDVKVNRNTLYFCWWYLHLVRILNTAFVHHNNNISLIYFMLFFFFGIKHIINDLKKCNNSTHEWYMSTTTKYQTEISKSFEWQIHQTKSKDLRKQTQVFVYACLALTKFVDGCNVLFMRTTLLSDLYLNVEYEKKKIYRSAKSIRTYLIWFKKSQELQFDSQKQFNFSFCDKKKVKIKTT